MEISCFQINQKRISDIIAEEGEIMTGVGDAINDEILRMQRGVEDLKRRKKRVTRDFKKSKKSILKIAVTLSNLILKYYVRTVFSS